MKVTINDIHEYLEQWYEHDNWSDFNMAWDSGYTELAASIVADRGAFDHRGPYDNEEIEVTEKAIRRMLRKYGKRQRDRDSKAVFGDAEVWVNPNTNEHAFIRNSDVDYLISAEEMKAYGYITSDQFYEQEPK